MLEELACRTGMLNAVGFRSGPRLPERLINERQLGIDGSILHSLRRQHMKPHNGTVGPNTCVAYHVLIFSRFMGTWAGSHDGRQNEK